MIVAMSTLYLTKGLHLASRRKFASSLFRSRGGSIEGRSNLCMVATSTAPADITADRLSNLRKEMKQDGLDCIIVPTEDPHMSEYTAPYYYRREYISGFTGEMTLRTHQHPKQLSWHLQLLMMLSHTVWLFRIIILYLRFSTVCLLFRT